MMRGVSGQAARAKANGRIRLSPVEGGESESAPDVGDGDDDYNVRTDYLVDYTDGAG
jgi:peroxin-6